MHASYLGSALVLLHSYKARSSFLSSATTTKAQSMAWNY